MGNVNSKLKQTLTVIKNYIDTQQVFRRGEWNDIGVPLNAKEITIMMNNIITTETGQTWTTFNIGVSQFRLLTELTKITLIDCTYDNLDFLHNQRKLKYLKLVNMPALKSIKGIMNHTYLEYIGYSGECNIKDWFLLSHCSNLRLIEVPHNTDLQRLGNMRIEIKRCS